MKTYKGMSRKELVQKCIEGRIKQAKEYNFNKHGNNDFPRANENPSNWYNLYKTYPMESKKYGICLIKDFETLTKQGFIS